MRRIETINKGKGTKARNAKSGPFTVKVKVLKDAGLALETGGICRTHQDRSPRLA